MMTIKKPESKVIDTSSEKMNISVLVFKTNILTKDDVMKVSKHLDKNPLQVRWNVDLEDIDKVLRIETKFGTKSEDIIKKITAAGFTCHELL